MASRLAIAEDHELVREGLKALLKDDPSFELVAEAKDGLQAVELVKKRKPDVLLLDLRIPRLHGLEVLRQVQDAQRTHVVIVTMHSDEPYIIEAFRSGASGYVLKDSPPKVLKEAIRVVAEGSQFICDPLQQKALKATLKRALPGGGTTKGLTKRELVVLEQAASGRTSQEIAAALFISRRTAEAHRANLMKKLGLKSQTDLVLYAIRTGLIAA